MISRLPAFVVVWLFSVPAGAQFPIELPPRIVEVARAKTYVVHGVNLGGLQRSMLVHTSLPKGGLKILFQGGDSAVPGPPMAIDRIFHHRRRLVTAIAVGGRVVLLTAHHRATVMRGIGDQTPRFGKAVFELRLFDGATGKMQSVTKIKSPTKKASLSAKDGLIIAMGVSYRIKDNKLVQVEK